MKVKIIHAVVLFFFVMSAGVLRAQEPEVIKKNGYTLTFINLDPKLDKKVKTRLIDTFFKVYPKLSKEFNKHARKEVTFFIDTAYAGVAEAGGGRVRFSHKWLHDHPGDIDVVTHETMHIVQAYPHNAGPGWLTEGIADYVRYRFGVDNKGAGWALPNYKSSQHYTNSYRVTARFLDWIEKQYPGFVKKMDSAMRNNEYSPQLWKQWTGKDLDALWKTYGEDQGV